MRKLTFRMAPALTLTLLALGAAGQEAEESTRAVARELLEVSGAGQMGHQAMQQIITSFKSNMPDVPQEFWDELMRDVDPNELVELAIPIYVKHLTKEEMEATTAFYKTPAGQALLAKLPVIMQESLNVGQKWGTQLAANVQKRLEKRSKSQTNSIKERPNAEQESAGGG